LEIDSVFDSDFVHPPQIMEHHNEEVYFQDTNIKNFKYLNCW